MKPFNFKLRRIFSAFVLLTMFLVSIGTFKLSSSDVEASELTQERTLTSKVYDLGNGEKKAVFHSSPIHYRDENGLYKDINTEIVESENDQYDYQVVEGIYEAYFKKNFTDSNLVKLIHGDNEVYIESNDLMLLTESSEMTLHEANDVQAKLENNKVTYEDAYTQGVSVEMSYGRDAFIRELVIDSYEDLRIPDSFEGILDLGFAFSLQLSDSNDVFVGDQLWDGEEIVTDQMVLLFDEGRESLAFVPPVLIDAEDNQVPLSLKLVKNGDMVEVQKLIPLQVLQEASYPVRADDVLSVFPTEDGVVANWGATYSTVRSASTGAYASSNATNAIVGQTLITTTYYIYRWYMYFDTSSLTSAATISDATLKLYGSADNSTTDFDVTMVAWSEGTAISTTDFNGLGTTSYGSLNTSGWTTSGYNDLTITNTSIISKTGNTLVGLRSSRDISGTTPSGGEYVTIYMNDNSGTSQDPVLEITYSVPNTAPTVTAINPAQDAGQRTVSFSTIVSDANRHVTSLTVEYSTDNSVWQNATISDVSAVGDEGDGFVLAAGSISDIDTDLDGSVGLTVTWDAGTDLDDTEDSTVYFRITPNDGTENGSTQTSPAFALDTSDPTTPGSLTCSSCETANSANLFFGTTSSDTNFSEYRIYYKEGVSGVTTSDTQQVDSNLANVSFNGATYTTVGGLTPNTQYVANIWAYDAYGNNAPATEVAFQTLAATPGLPTVTALSTTTMNVVLSANGNPTSTEYAICKSDDGSTCASDGYLQLDGTLGVSEVWQTRDSWGGESGQTVSGLSENTSYRFLAKARNSLLTETAFSTASTAVYTYAAAVTAPSLSDATDKTTLSIALSWVDATQFGIKIEQDNDCDDSYDSTIYDNASSNAANPLTIDSGISANSCYKYRLSSYNGDGVLNTTDTAVTSTITTPPGQPQNLTVLTVDTDELGFSWDAVDGASSYTLYNNSDDSELATVYAPTTLARITELAPNTEYTVYVRAINANGSGIASSTVTQSTDATAPANLAHSTQTTSSILWTWDNDGQSGFLARDKNNTDDNSGTITDSSWLQEGLSANTAYTLEVRATNLSATETSFSEITRYTSQNDPESISFSNVGTDSVMITADGSFPNNGVGSSLIHFDNGDGVTQDVTDGTSWTNTGLNPNTGYTYTVYATNGDGDQTNSVSSEIYTLANAVLSLTADDTSAETVELSWRDNGQTGMKIEQDTGCSGTYDTTLYDNAATNTVSPYEVSVSPGTCYQFRISSYNVSGVLNSTTVAETDELTTVLPAPENLAASVSSSGFTLSWDAVEGASYYYIYNADTDGLFARTASTTYSNNFFNTTSYNFYIKSATSLGVTGVATERVNVDSSEVTESETITSTSSSSSGGSRDSGLVSTGTSRSGLAESSSDSSDSSNSGLQTERDTSEEDTTVGEVAVEEVEVDSVDNSEEDRSESDSSSDVTAEKSAEESSSVQEVTEISEADFVDLQGHWAETVVHELYDAIEAFEELSSKISPSAQSTDGESAGEELFNPDDAITRAEFVKMIVRTFNYEATVSSLHPFTDVTSDDWFEPFVASAYVNGLIKGFDDGTFRPNQPLKRNEALKILLLAAGLEDEVFAFNGNYVLPFEDVSVDSWYYPFVAYATSEGIVHGYSSKEFRPHANITKAEAAKIIVFLLGLHEEPTP